MKKPDANRITANHTKSENIQKYIADKAMTKKQ